MDYRTAALPSDACTREGYWSFFEAFVQSPEVRQNYTDATARKAIDPFRIALIDSRWFYVAGQSREAVELTETHGADSFRVEYVRAEFDKDGEIVRTHGKTGAYEFRFKDGCWRLTASTE